MIQLKFLNYLLKTQDTSLLSENNITVDFFNDYIAEFNFINEHLSTYGCIPDITTFLVKFPNFDIIEFNDSRKFLIDALYQDKNKRFLGITYNKVRTLLEEDKVDEAMDLYVTSIDQAVQAKHLDAVDIFKNTSRYQDYLEKCEDFNKYYVKTGFPELDKVLGGFDRREELATIVARPNVGKSWALLQVAKAAAEQGLVVGIYSGEMALNKVAYRMDTLISHISNGGIIHGNADYQNVYKEYIDELPYKYQGSIKVLTPAMLGGPAGVTALRAFIEKDHLDMLCIDQHSLLEDDRHAKTPVEKASNISKDLKNLQVLKGIPIIAVSQQNRASTIEKGTDTANIAQSDRIGQDSTVVIFFERDEKDKNILTLNLVKSRDSENGKKFKYHADFDKGIFEYLPEPDSPPGDEGIQELHNQFDAYENNNVDPNNF